MRRGRSASRSSYRLSWEEKDIVTEKAWVYPCVLSSIVALLPSTGAKK